MPSILVVEHEGRYIERIQDALAAEGWRARFVAGRPEALRSAASEAPNLVLVNAELPGAPELLRAFARRSGGPGAVALVGEGAGEEGLEADELLAKPFSDQELRMVVRRRLAATASGEPASPAAPKTAAGDDHKLTSREIFGDLLAEVESEIDLSAPPAAARVPVSAAAAPPPGSPHASSRPAAAAAARSVAGDDVEKRLERTLSGVPGLASRHRAAAGAPSRREPPQQHPPPPREEPPPQAPPEPPRREPDPPPPPAGDPPPAPRRRRSLRPDDDVDELLNMTLTGLELGQRPRRRPATAEAEIDLTELESLAGRRRRRSSDPAEPEAAAGQGTPSPKEPPAPPPPVPGAMPAAGGPVADADTEDDGAALPAIAAEAPGERAPGAAVPSSAPPETDPTEPAEASDEPPPTPAVEAPPPPPASGEPAVAPGAAPALAAADASAAPPAPAFPGPTEGRRFGHYTLLDRIAVGGMAEVWKARMSGVEGFQKTVAIKRILPHMNDDSDFVEMFIDEAKLAAQLNHPNITHIYDLGKIGDDYYIAMEYVEGRNLRAILNESRRKAMPLPAGFAVVVAARLASALDYAHRKRDFDDRDLELVHRDVSPQNVLISTDGDIKLCDFGISKAVAKISQTETGALKGKLQYMSPEQAWGRTVDARSDLFSLGALTFEMLTGERLFTGESEISVLEAVRECRVRRPSEIDPSVPPGLEDVILKALEREPADRYRNAGEMQQALEEVLYQLRPTPGQADVSAFLVRLEAAPEARPGVAREATATGGGEGVAASDPEDEGPASLSEASASGTGGGGVRSAGTPPAGAAAPMAAGVAGSGGWEGGSPSPTSTSSGAFAAAGAATGAGATPPATPVEGTGAGGTADPGTATGQTPPALAAPPSAAPPEARRRWWQSGGTPVEPPAPAPPISSAKVPPPADTPERTDAGVPTGAASPPGSAPPPPVPAGAAGGAAAGLPAATAARTPATEATSAGVATVDDGGARRRFWLVAAIVLLAIASVAAWLWWQRWGFTVPERIEPSAVTRPASPPVAGPATGADGDAGAPPAAAAPAAAAAPEIDLQRLVEEELARQNEEIRRQAEAEYQERARRIQEEIEALNRAEEEPEPPPGDTAPPATEPPSSPPPAAEPSAAVDAGAATAAGDGVLELASAPRLRPRRALSR